MAKNCKHHAHGQIQQQKHDTHNADRWTNIAASGELLAGLVSDAFWLATWVDLVTGLDEDVAGLSYPALACGISISILTAFGAALAHRGLYTLHQNQEAKTHGQYTALPTTDVFPAQSPTRLSAVQVIALFGDAISHTGDVAGPLTFIAMLAAKNKLPFWAKLAVQSGTTLFGALASIASVRTCADAMRKMNEAKQVPNIIEVTP